MLQFFCIYPQLSLRPWFCDNQAHCNIVIFFFLVKEKENKISTKNQGLVVQTSGNGMFLLNILFLLFYYIQLPLRTWFYSDQAHCNILDVLEKNFVPKIWKMEQKWAKNTFLNLLKNLVIIFNEFVLQWKLILFTAFLRKSHIWENCCA